MAVNVEVGNWFDKGILQGSTHLMVIEDTYEYEHYPVYASCDEDAIRLFNRSNDISLQRVTEVYDLRLGKAKQMILPHILRPPRLTA